MDKPAKAPISEERRLRLEQCRVKGLETRRMRAAIREAEAKQAKDALRTAYEQKVLGKKEAATPVPTPPKVKFSPVAVPIEETDACVHPEAADHSDEEFENVPQPPPPKPKAARVKSQPVQNEYVAEPSEPNYKQLYYKEKLNGLQASQQQASFAQQYQALPSSYHAADIARQTLKNKADKVVLDRVYRELFNL